MELKQLVYFETVARLLNFTNAAKELYVTQPTLTIAINNLENELGIKLFTRQKKRINLSSEGAVFLRNTHKILQAVQECQDEMTAMHPDAVQTLSIGLPANLGAWLYDIALNEYKVMKPHVQIVINDLGALEVLERIMDGTIELALTVIDDTLSDELEYMILKNGFLSLLLSKDHPLSQKPTITITELENEKIIMYKLGTTWIEKEIAQQFKACNQTLNIYMVAEQHLTLYNLVAQNMGISFTLDGETSAIKNYKNIVVRNLHPSIQYRAGIVWNKNKFLSQNSQHFLSYISQYKLSYLASLSG